DAVYIPPTFGLYQEISAGVFAIFREITPLVEGLSLDVAFSNGRAGAALNTFDCSTWTAQQWFRNGEDLHNWNGLCTDITDVNPNWGAGVKLFGCTGDSNQQWYFQQV
ncbi:ricin-type beta-trefoil lectin domain protein, partial [Kibdelosporangium lantanae]